MKTYITFELTFVIMGFFYVKKVCLDKLKIVNLV